MPIAKVHVQNDLPSPTRVQGVVVEIYNLAAVFQTGGTTDVNGEVVFTLPVGSYDVLFYKPGVAILPSQPQRIVVNPAPPNTFLVTSHVRVLPETINPLKCRITGRLVGAGGDPAKSRLIFSTVKQFMIEVGDIILPAERIEIEADDTGYFDFELYRLVNYNGYPMHLDCLFGLIPPKLDVRVPDMPSLELAKLLFPAPIIFTFSATTISLAVGVLNQSISYEIELEDGSDRNSVPWATTKLTNTDDTVVDAVTADGVLVLTAKKPGTATIGVERRISDQALYNPEPAFAFNTVLVTVT